VLKALLLSTPTDAGEAQTLIVRGCTRRGEKRIYGMYEKNVRTVAHPGLYIRTVYKHAALSGLEPQITDGNVLQIKLKELRNGTG
jgi:hypothetical protein